MFTLLYGEFTQDNTHQILLGSAWFRLRYEKITLWCVFRLTVYILFLLSRGQTNIVTYTQTHTRTTPKTILYIAAQLEHRIITPVLLLEKGVAKRKTKFEIDFLKTKCAKLLWITIGFMFFCYLMCFDSNFVDQFRLQQVNAEIYIFKRSDANDIIQLAVIF